MDAVADIKDKLSVEEVVGDYVELKRSGSNFKALSPFTQENTPSFVVSPQKQIWHCFSTNKGGDMFTFVEEMEGVDFKGALEVLARKAGIDLSQYSRGDGTTTKLKQRLRQLLALATTYYQKTLFKNKSALEYVRQAREFSKETTLQFNLGYSPSSFEAFNTFAKSKGYSQKELEQAGLSRQGNRGPFDMFRGRVMIPLKDGSGQPIGFTARLLDGDGPKYVNTPQTLLYDKSRHVYGLHLAKDAIRNADVAVVVEGNLDVISSHQAGIKNVVAIAGTALTSHQVKQLKRFCSTLVFALDQDKAGITATVRSISVALNAELELAVATIPSGKDPDELIKQNVSLWEQTISDAVPALDWYIEHLFAQFDAQTAGGKEKIVATFSEMVKNIESKVVIEHYTQVLSKKLQLSRSAIEQKITARSKQPKHYKQPKKDVANIVTKAPQQEVLLDSFLSLLVTYPDTRRYLSRIPQHLEPSQQQQEVIEQLQHSKQSPLKNSSDFVKILQLRAEQLFESFNAQERAQEAQRLSLRLTQIVKQQYKKTLTHKLKLAEDQGNTAEVQRLLAEFNNLNTPQEDYGNQQDKSNQEAGDQA